MISRAWTIILVPLCFHIGSCSQSVKHQSSPRLPDDAKNQKDEPISRNIDDKATCEKECESERESRATHLLFSAIDPMESPWQSSVYQLDLKSHQVTRLLTGESADPAFFHSTEDVLFFNRSFDSQNFRRIAPSSPALTISSQRKFAGGEIGDPHDVLAIGNDRALLALYTRGQLAIMQLSTGLVVETLDIDWDLPATAELKPEALVMTKLDNRTFIYVVHQALTVRDGLTMANGSQQVFVLEIMNGKIVLHDMNPLKARIQGIKTKGSFPIPVHYINEDKFLLVSLCSRLVVAMEDDSENHCTNTVEELDPRTNTVKELWDFADYKLFMNGPITAGPTINSFYANVDQEFAPGEFKKSVVYVDLSDHSVTAMYQFSTESGGFWGTFYDELGKTLYIGDIETNGAGKFVVLKEGIEQRSIDLKQVPYSGIFLTKSGS